MALMIPKSWKGAKDKPMMVSEFNGHMYPTKPWDPIDRRVKHALRHARVLDDAYSYSELAGAIGWCAFDYNTHQDFGSGDHICYHGVSLISSATANIAAALYAIAKSSKTSLKSPGLSRSAIPMNA
jgi:beta-galactosidase